MSVLTNVELVMWSPVPNTAPPTRRQAQQALMTESFDPARAFEIAGTTAFRRAVKCKESKTLKATVWGKSPTVHAQLDRLVEDPSSERIRREFVANWNYAEERTPPIEGTQSLEEFELCRIQYTWGDLTQVVQTILTQDGLGAYTPRRAGGVYFVPVRSLELLDRLERACRVMGLNLLRYQVPDTEAQRAEVSDAIVAGLSAEIDAHQEAIEGYNVDSTPAGFVERRREAITQTAGLVTRVGGFLNGHAVELQDRLTALDLRCAELITSINQSRPTGGGRHVRLGGAR